MVEGVVGASKGIRCACHLSIKKNNMPVLLLNQYPAKHLANEASALCSKLNQIIRRVKYLIGICGKASNQKVVLVSKSITGGQTSGMVIRVS
jgi:hypothetical protein